MSAWRSTPDASDGLRDVVVVGGGVVGLASARELARAGARVTVVDPQRADARATWAAGGMLAPLGEAPEPGPFLDLALRSLTLWPDFAREVESAAERTVGLHLDGKLLTAATSAEEVRLDARRNWLRAEGHAARWVDGAGARTLEPALSGAVRAGLLLEGNGRVDNRTLQEALGDAVRAAGGEVRRGTVVALLRDRGRACGVALDRGEALRAAWVVLAAGAWSGGLAGLPRPLPVRPVRGQMLAFAAPERPLERVVTSARVYLIPRETADGPVVVVGATSEEVGFDRSVDPAAQTRLASGARALVPALVAAPVVERWAGLRPGTPDDLPLLGPDPGTPGLLYATGHYRNGILLAPATARAVLGWITGDPPGGMEAFRPDRFGG
ncbi:MAG: glycine oxidase ThiO [Longimicrobiales bacterium]|nr:glycine oxidase ThiO [Longimicrobiales bacterium]